MRGASVTTVSPSTLGEDLARLVWEAFTDFVADALQGVTEDEEQEIIIPEEALIFFMWVHTRVLQQSFVQRADAESLKEALDSMHRAVFEDLEAHGLSRRQLPLFEQRVSARYSQYYAASESESAEPTVAELAAREIYAADGVTAAGAALLAEASAVAAGPLRDFLQEVELSG
jgi:hypothetical protein